MTPCPSITPHDDALPRLTLLDQTIPLLLSAPCVLVGLSGGRDSIALIESLRLLRGCSPIGCHVHHGIRTDEADRDANFSRQWCLERDIPFLIKKVDVPLLAHDGKISIEEAARHARRQCFEEWATQEGTKVIALAHHINDQAETILLNLCRGSAGIRGMKPVSTVSTTSDKLTILRPLLAHTREQLTHFLQERHLTWVDDSTNDTQDYTRNALRHNILPRLNDIMHRDVTPIICRSSRLAHETETALDQALDLMELTDPQGRLYLPKIITLPPALKKVAIFRYLKQAGIPKLTEEITIRVLDILNKDTPTASSKIMLPGGWIASRKEKRLRLLPPTA
ncbi:MAG: tRNA lysidine(34) synthetase TilS [Akkermansia sp.]